MKKTVQNVTPEKKHTETVYTLPEGMTGKQFTQFIHDNRSECSEIDETLKEVQVPKAKNRKKAKGESFRKPSPVILTAIIAPEKELYSYFSFDVPMNGNALEVFSRYCTINVSKVRRDGENFCMRFITTCTERLRTIELECEELNTRLRNMDGQRHFIDFTKIK